MQSNNNLSKALDKSPLNLRNNNNNNNNFKSAEKLTFQTYNQNTLNFKSDLTKSIFCGGD